MKAPILLGAAVTLLTAPLAMAQMRSADVAARQGRTGEVATPAVPDKARAADIHVANRRVFDMPGAAGSTGLTFYDRTPNSIRPTDTASVRTNGPSPKGPSLAPEKAIPPQRMLPRASDVAPDALIEKAIPPQRTLPRASDVAVDADFIDASTEKAAPLKRSSSRASDVASDDLIEKATPPQRPLASDVAVDADFIDAGTEKAAPLRRAIRASDVAPDGR